MVIIFLREKISCTFTGVTSSGYFQQVSNEGAPNRLYLYTTSIIHCASVKFKPKGRAYYDIYREDVEVTFELEVNIKSLHTVLHILHCFTAYHLLLCESANNYWSNSIILANAIFFLGQTNVYSSKAMPTKYIKCHSTSLQASLASLFGWMNNMQFQTYDESPCFTIFQ